MEKFQRSGKSDVDVQIIVATADKIITRGAQILVRIQASMRVMSKREGRMRSLLIHIPRRKRGPSIWDQAFRNSRRCWQQRLRLMPDSAVGIFHKRFLTMLILSSTKAFQDIFEE
jgi:hypothetical protein